MASKCEDFFSIMRTVLQKKMFICEHRVQTCTHARAHRFLDSAIHFCAEQLNSNLTVSFENDSTITLCIRPKRLSPLRIQFSWVSIASGAPPASQTGNRFAMPIIGKKWIFGNDGLRFSRAYRRAYVRGFAELGSEVVEMT